MTVAEPVSHNETAEMGALARGLAAHLGRRRASGMRRTTALAPPEPLQRATRPQGPQGAPNRAAEPPAGPKNAPSTGAPAAPSSTAQPPQRPSGASGPSTLPAAAPAPLSASAPNAASIRSLPDLAQAVTACESCKLARGRTHAFVSAGTGSSGVLFLDEVPGIETDATGDPFRGPGGQLLANIITKGMGLDLTAVQVASLVKCQPRAGHPPEPEELSTCRAWLNRQIELLDPKVIVTLGRPASTALLGIEAPLGRLRGQVHTLEGRSVIATFHPEYLARVPQEKKKTWEDIQLAMTTAGIPLPGRS